MTHIEFIKANYQVIAQEGNSILFFAEGELCCEINGEAWACRDADEFFELVEMYGDETFEE